MISCWFTYVVLLVLFQQLPFRDAVVLAPTRSDTKQNVACIVILRDDVAFDEFEHHLFHRQQKLLGTVGTGIEITHLYEAPLRAVALQTTASNNSGDWSPFSWKECLSEVPGVLSVHPSASRSLPGSFELDVGSPAGPARRSLGGSSADSVHPPWGIDVLDSAGEVDGEYSPTYHGAGVDVYVVDSGIDTKHVEFAAAAGSERTVENIYDAFLPSGEKIPENNDEVGHGTHIAAVIGGVHVGVSRDVNLYGVKIIGPKGTADDRAILKALEFISDRIKSQKLKNSAVRSVVSMSFGGACSTADCTKDAVNIFVEALAEQDILISVASGNSGCNACNGAPNGAESAFVVGATTQGLQQASFSNFGQCIDVLAPGAEIFSACSSRVCSDQNKHDWYTRKSGTSMACPHVTGILAQLLEKFPNGTLSTIYDSLVCDAVKDAVLMDARDTITRNLFLQVPGGTPDATEGDYCKIGSGCVDECSSAGACLHGETTSDVLEAQSSCFCDIGYWGEGCTSQRNDACVANHYPFVMLMGDSYGDGWSLSRFTISHKTTGQIADHAFDSLCDGKFGSDSYCLRDGCYELAVTRGDAPSEVSWSACGVTGGAPSRLSFCIDNSRACTVVCDGGLVDLLLRDKSRDGWDGAYYTVRSSTSGELLSGGSVSQLEADEITHTLCVEHEAPQSHNTGKGAGASEENVGHSGFDGEVLTLDGTSPPSCVIVQLDSLGYYPDEISFSACGVEAKAAEILQICVPANIIDKSKKDCSAVILNAPKGQTDEEAASNGLSGCRASDGLPVSLTVLDLATTIAGNPIEVKYTIGDFSDTFAGAFEQQGVCVPNGCHKFSINNTTSIPVIDQGNSLERIDPPPTWFLCGIRGTIPWSSQICVDSAYGLCYGLSGCAYVRSDVHKSHRQFLFLSHSDPKSNALVSDSFQNIHGVHDLLQCSHRSETLSDDGNNDDDENAGGVVDGQQYFFDIGFGRHAATGDRWSMCGTEGSFPARGTIVFSNGGRDCEVTSSSDDLWSCTPTNSKVSVRSASSVPQLLAKIDSYGDGWGSSRDPGIYSIVDDQNKVVASGGLVDGSLEIDVLCLDLEKCYRLNFAGTLNPEEMYVLMCGSLLNARDITAHPGGLRFCVEDVGACVFDGDTALALFDDDFPLAGGEQDGDTGAAGSGAVGASVVNVMTSILEVTLQVYTDKDRRVTVRDVAFLEHALHHVIAAGGLFDVWGVKAISLEIKTDAHRKLSTRDNTSISGHNDNTFSSFSHPDELTENMVRTVIGITHPGRVDVKTTGQTVSRSLGKDYAFYAHSVSVITHISTVLPSGIDPYEADQALRFLIQSAATSGQLQEDAVTALNVLKALESADDDGTPEALLASTPMKATLQNINNVPHAEPVVMRKASANRPRNDQYFIIWNEDSRNEDNIKSGFPLAQYVLLTSLCTALILLYLYSLYYRYRPPGTQLVDIFGNPKRSREVDDIDSTHGEGDAGSDIGATANNGFFGKNGYKAISLVGSTHSELGEDSNIEGISPLHDADVSMVEL